MHKSKKRKEFDAPKALTNSKAPTTTGRQVNKTKMDRPGSPKVAVYCFTDLMASAMALTARIAAALCLGEALAASDVGRRELLPSSRGCNACESMCRDRELPFLPFLLNQSENDKADNYDCHQQPTPQIVCCEGRRPTAL